MARLLSRSTWEKFSVFHKEWPFLAQNVFISNFLVQIRNQHLRIDPCANIQPNWTKDNGTQILTCNDTENSLMTSAYLIVMTSEELLYFFWESLCQSTVMPNLVVIGKQIKEKQRNRCKQVAGCFYDAIVFYTGIESTTVLFLVHTMLA